MGTANIPGMARQPAEDTGAWNFRDIPRGLMQRVENGCGLRREDGQAVVDGFGQSAARGRWRSEGFFRKESKPRKIRDLILILVRKTKK